MNITPVPVTQCPDDALEALFSIMYAPYDVAREANWLDVEDGGDCYIARDDAGVFMGMVRLMPLGMQSKHISAECGQATVVSDERLIRQVIIADYAQGKGVGRALMTAVEQVALREGAQRIGLGSRYTAYGFYEKLGYTKTGESYISGLTKIPHTHMVKCLG